MLCENMNGRCVVSNNPRTVVVHDTTATIHETPLADEWPAGDPVPADKETLGYVTRTKEQNND